MDQFSPFFCLHPANATTESSSNFQIIQVTSIQLHKWKKLNYPSYLPPTKAVSIILVEKGPANFRRRTARGPANCFWLVWNSLTERSGPAQILVWGCATCVSLCRTLQHPMRIWRWGFIIEAWLLLLTQNSLGHLTRQEIGQDDRTVILKHRFIPSSTFQLVH